MLDQKSPFAGVEKERKSHQDARYKKLNWILQSKAVEQFLKNWTKELGKEVFPDGVYVDRETKTNIVRITLGKSRIKSSITGNLAVQQGGGLIIQQSPQGPILVTIYPCESVNFKHDDPYIHLFMLNNAWELNEKILVKAVNAMRMYVRVSDEKQAPSLSDKLLIKKLSFQSIKYSRKGGIPKFLATHWLISLILAILTALSVLKAFAD